jgi:hypothetical protein
MSRRFFALAFALGLACLAWVGAGFAGSNWLALGVTGVITAVYLLGAFELKQFRAATGALNAALQDLAQPPAALSEWLARVPATLRNAVRLRVEGERGGPPAPALTPYLVGLLVMLGMLGTFLGLIVTFKGAVFALEGSTDLQAMRAALAGPLHGLGLSFGTSVAGVAASAMLGLMSAISRRERLEVARLLDQRIAGVLLPFSLGQQRREAYRALESQAQALPEVAGRLEALMERIEQRSAHLDQQLMERQLAFQRELTLAYTGLAESVGTSLKESLAAGAATAGDTIRPLVEGAMAKIVQETARLHERVGHAAQDQASQLALAFEQRSAALVAAVGDSLARTQSAQAATEQQRLEAWMKALQGVSGELQAQWRRAADEALASQRTVAKAIDESARQITERASGQAVETMAQAARLLEESRELVRSRTEGEARWIAQHGERMDQMAGLWRSELAALRQEESQRGAAAVERLQELQAAVTEHLATLGAALEAPITRLLQTAAEVPQAAAAVITQLHDQVGRATERDGLALQERTLLLERMAALLQSLEQATGEQRAGIEAMVHSASTVLQQAGDQFANALQAQASQSGVVAAHVSASAVELSSLAQAFEQGVQLFQASNDKLVEGLQRVEAALGRSTERSDEQLAYYVAQAREVIDLSIASQQGLVENLRELHGRPGKALALVEGVRA